MQTPSDLTTQFIENDDFFITDAFTKPPAIFEVMKFNGAVFRNALENGLIDFIQQNPRNENSARLRIKILGTITDENCHVILYNFLLPTNHGDGATSLKHHVLKYIWSGNSDIPKYNIKVMLDTLRLWLGNSSIQNQLFFLKDIEPKAINDYAPKSLLDYSFITTDTVLSAFTRAREIYIEQYVSRLLPRKTALLAIQSFIDQLLAGAIEHTRSFIHLRSADVPGEYKFLVFSLIFRVDLIPLISSAKDVNYLFLRMFDRNALLPPNLTGHHYTQISHDRPKMSAEFEAYFNKPGIHIAFAVNNIFDPTYRIKPAIAEFVGETNLRLQLTISYDRDPAQLKLMKALFNEGQGILSEAGRRAKFLHYFHQAWHDKDWIKYDNFTEHKLGEKNILSISFKISRYNHDDLLQTLSLINDALDVLKVNDINPGFELVNIIDEIKKAFLAIKEKENIVFFTLDYLKKLLVSHQPDDAISWLNCLLIFPAFDMSKQEFSPQLFDQIFMGIQNFFKEKSQKKGHSSNTPAVSDMKKFLEKFNLWQRIKLFKPCLGKEADDLSLFTWQYTEWHFIQDVRFSFGADKACFINIEEQPVATNYGLYYARFAVNFTLFKRELLKLATYIDLSFPEELQKAELEEWHRLIKFTPECSEKLYKKMLQIDMDSLKQIVKVKYQFEFWKRSNTPLADVDLLKYFLKFVEGGTSECISNAVALHEYENKGNTIGKW